MGGGREASFPNKVGRPSFLKKRSKKLFGWLSRTVRKACAGRKTGEACGGGLSRRGVSIERCDGASMALSIKTGEADELARSLARLTGESMTEAVTVALRERLARERARRESDADLPARLAALSGELRWAYDTRPISRQEWDAASGDEG